MITLAHQHWFNNIDGGFSLTFTVQKICVKMLSVICIYLIIAATMYLIL